MSEKETVTIDREQLLRGMKKLSAQFEVNQIRLVDVEKRHAKTDMNSSRWGELVSKHSTLVREQTVIAEAVVEGARLLGLPAPPDMTLWLDAHPAD